LDTVPYLTNENIMDLTVLPEHLIVLGGGYVGLEFGQMFGRFGSRVTLIQSPAQIIPAKIPKLRGTSGVLEEEGLTFLLSARATRVKRMEAQL